MSIERASLPPHIIESVKSDMTTRVIRLADLTRDARAREAELRRKIQAPIHSIIQRDEQATEALAEFENTREKARTRLTPRRARWPRLHTDINLSQLDNDYSYRPFDEEWTALWGGDDPRDLGARAYADKSSGRFGYDNLMVSGSWGNAAAGLGVIATTTEQTTVAVVSAANYGYSYEDEASGVVSHTNGGFGLLTYDVANDGSASILNNSQAIIWSDGTGWFEDHSSGGEGWIDNYFNPGPIVTLVPGHTYLVWTWCFGSNDGNFAVSSFDAQLYWVAFWHALIAAPAVTNP